MDKQYEVLLQAMKLFQPQKPDRETMKKLVLDRVERIKPLFKLTSLSELGSLKAFSERGENKLEDFDDGRHLILGISLRTQGIFGAEYGYEKVYDKDRGYSHCLTKIWGLTRKSTWCYGEVLYDNRHGAIQAPDSIKVELVDFAELLKRWRNDESKDEKAILIKIWYRLGLFALSVKDEADRRAEVIDPIADQVKTELLLAQAAKLGG